MLNPNFPSWATGTQAILFLFISVTFFAFWRLGEPVGPVGGKKVRQKDPGIFWLGMATAVWGLWALWHALKIAPYPANELAFDHVLPFASTINSAFFLLAAAHLDHGPVSLQFIQGQKRWYTIVIAGSLAIATLTGVLENRFPDFLLALVASIVVYYSLLKSFLERREWLLQVLTVISFLMLVTVQVLAQFKISDELLSILLVPSKATLVVLLLALAISYYLNRLELLPEDTMFLNLTGVLDPTGRKWQMILSVQDEFENKVIWVDPTPYRDLLTLACLKKTRDEDHAFLVVDNVQVTPLNIHRVRKYFGQLGMSIVVNSRKASYKLSLPPGNIVLDVNRLTRDEEWANLLRHYGLC